jgi:hypothetical protein
VITLRQLLEALLGEDEVKGQKGLGEYTETVYLNFTHFQQLREIRYDVSSDYLRNTWERGVAFQASSEQNIFDGMIVTYSGSLTEPWDKSKLGTFSWQGKFRKQAAPEQILDHLVGPTVDGKRPEREVVMLLDLSTTTPFQNTNSHISSAYAKTVLPEKAFGDGYCPEVVQERWCIAVRGRTSTEYPVLRAFEPQISQMLRSALLSDATEGFA